MPLAVLPLGLATLFPLEPRASADITGTILPSVTEAELRANSYIIFIALTNDTWVASGAAFNAQRQNIINGITSDKSEAAGWNSEVRDKIPVTNVTRISSTIVQVDIDATPAYDITENETITITVPASAVNGVNAIVASPTFDVTFIPIPVVEEEDLGAGGVGPLREPRSRRQKRGQQKAPKKRTERSERDVEPDWVKKSRRQPSPKTPRVLEKPKPDEAPPSAPDFQAMAARMATQAEQMQALGLALEDLELEDEDLALLLLLTI